MKVVSTAGAHGGSGSFRMPQRQQVGSQRTQVTSLARVAATVRNQPAFAIDDEGPRQSPDPAISLRLRQHREGKRLTRHETANLRQILGLVDTDGEHAQPFLSLQPLDAGECRPLGAAGLTSTRAEVDDHYLAPQRSEIEAVAIERRCRQRRRDWTWGLKTRTANALRSHGYTSREAVAAASESHLLALTSFGHGSLADLQRWLGRTPSPGSARNAEPAIDTPDQEEPIEKK